MNVSVVIPNWNGRHFLELLFADLRAQAAPAAEILVVDNGSTDGSAAWAAGHGARVIRFDTNRGFAAAVNHGVREASGDLVAVLNNDLRLTPGWLQRALAALTSWSASFVVGKVLSATADGVIDGTFDALSCGATAWRCGHGQPDGPLWSVAREVQFPPFTAVLLRRVHFLAAGGLDERLESYLEDVEFGLRCASKGYSGVYTPEAVAYHLGSATLGRWHARTVRQISRNQLLLVSCHYSRRMLRRFGWRIAVGQLLWGLVAARHGQGMAWLTGKWEGLRQFRGYRTSGDDQLETVLRASEADIRRYQASDLYWRLYFALT